MCRGGRRCVAIVRRVEQGIHVTRRSPTGTDLEHRSDEETHHVMKKAIRSHHEHQSARPVAPSRLGHGAPLMIGLGPGSVGCKGAEAMIARDTTRRGVERRAVERLREPKLVSPAKGTMGLVIGSYEIAIAPRSGAIACVELGTHLEGLRHPHVRRQHRIQGPSKLRGFPSRRDDYADRLPARMYTRIRSTRPESRNGRVTKALKRLFDHPLYRALLRLSLPAAEVRAVILQNELHGAIGHRNESYPTAKVGARKPLRS